MIKNIVHKGLEAFFLHGLTKGIQSKHATKLARILDRLDAAKAVKDMDAPGYGLHPLKGDRKGYWSIKVSGNWRVIFRFEEGHVYDVNYLDYH
ncbi:MAG: peptidase [Desulfovibrio sp.]|nr:MAG: peptidase [Desulfovibrio sp.]